MEARKVRRADRALRPAMRSLGRPPVGRREHRERFWEGIAGGLSSEDAGVAAGVSPGGWFALVPREWLGWSHFLLSRFRGVICLLLSEKRLLFFTPASVGCVRSPASWVGHRRRSRVSCAATLLLVAEALSIGPRTRSGIRIGRPVAPRFPSWPPTTPSANTFRIAWVG